MLLIYPPIARSTEAPLGIARLAAAIRGSGGQAICLDLCRAALDWLVEQEPVQQYSDTRSRRSLKNRKDASQSLNASHCYEDLDRYARAVEDLNHSLLLISGSHSVAASLADYQDSRHSPLKLADLRHYAEHYAETLFFPLFSQCLDPLLAEISDGWVGISICFLSQALMAFSIMGYIKATRPDLKIAIGGGLVTSYEKVNGCNLGQMFPDLVDLSISGAGEDRLAALVGKPESGDGGKRRKVWVPYFGDFALQSYTAPARILPYNFSWGCPWKKCAFCPETAENSPYQGLSAAQALEEVAQIAGQYRPGLLHFTDNEIAPLYLSALAAQRELPRWYGFARFSSRLLDRNFCQALARSGCIMLQLGLESADQRVLDSMGKGTRVEEIEIILDNLKEAGIGSYLYVLLGTPQEDRDAALKTRDWMAAWADRIDFMNVAVFNLPASGSDAKRLATQFFYEGELSLYRDFRHPAGWDRGVVRRFLSREFYAEPRIREIAKRVPPIFTSNHAAFFLPRHASH